tara:strand:- start:1543 stop:2142 length:600 start_codon:yes stop_codon:yes gene_type:complete
MAKYKQEFKRNLEKGLLGESMIAKWLTFRNGVVLPAYQQEINTGKGPRVYTKDGKLVAPDMVYMHREKGTVWVEAKQKSRFSWYRKKKRWETGIDAHHWSHYQEVSKLSDAPLWLLFLHTVKDPWNHDIPYLPSTESFCPVGLFGISAIKAAKIYRYAPQHAKGMVYWGHEDLSLLASLEEVQEADKAIQSEIEQLSLF